MLERKDIDYFRLQKILFSQVLNEKTKRVDLSHLSIHIISSSLLRCLSESNIRVIDLRGNYLDTLPEELAQLGFIENVKLKGNPLKFIPKELQTNPNQIWSKLQKYLVSLQNRASRWKERKILFVGEEETGKTTLIQCFLTKKNKTSCKNNLATDGIQIYRDISLQSGQIKDSSAVYASSDLLINAWDLGGQQIFYPTHQFFLSSHSTYVVVFNLEKPDYSRIEYWLRTLKHLSNQSLDNDQSGLPATQVYLVGTHADSEICTEEYLSNISEILNQKFRKNVFRDLQGIFMVSSKTGSGISHLKEQILQGFLRTSINIPVSWVRFADCLRQRKEILSWTNWISYTKWAKEIEIKDEDLINVTKIFCDFGYIVFHESKENLEKSLIILDPQWLSDLMTCIISVKTSNWIKAGILEYSKIPQIFSQYPKTIHPILLDLLQNFNIIYQQLNSKNFIVPSLLDHTANKSQLLKYWQPFCDDNFIEIGRMIRFPFLPIGFFDKFIIHMFHVSVINIKLMWRYGMIINLKNSNDNNCIGIVKYSEDTHELEIRIRYFKPKKLSSSFENISDSKQLQKQQQFKQRQRKKQQKSENNEQQDQQEEEEEELFEYFLYAPGHLLRIILDVIDTFIDGFNMGSDLNRFVICSHCIENNVPTPFLFTFIEIIEAIKEQNIFIFCEHICSPTRCVNVIEIAPDIAMTDMEEINNDLIVIDKEIGRGGFGTVYSGILNVISMEDENQTNEKIPVPIAIKEIIIKGGSSAAVEEFFLEFQREAFLMSKLNHINLVKFFGITINPLRMILELVNFGDLFHFLHPEKIEIKPGQFTSSGQIPKEKFPWNLRLLMAYDIAKGMRYLQKISPPVIHRDLRSPNIFISSFSEDVHVTRCKIADFGLSRSSAVGLFGALGTWQWIAPEVLEGKISYNELSDNYSFGICCWEIATRSFPFDEFESRSEFLDPLTNTIAAHLIKPEIINNNLRPSKPPPEEGAPDEFIDIIYGCLKKEPKDRLTFDEIVKRLEILLNIPETKIENTDSLLEEKGIITIDNSNSMNNSSLNKSSSSSSSSSSSTSSTTPKRFISKSAPEIKSLPSSSNSSSPNCNTNLSTTTNSTTLTSKSSDRVRIRANSIMRKKTSSSSRIPSFSNFISAFPTEVIAKSESRITTMYSHDNYLIIAFTKGKISTFSILDDKEKYQWDCVHKDSISDILYIPLEDIYWTIDRIGNISIWKPPASLSDENCKSIQFIPSFAPNEQFASINLSLVIDQSGARTIWVYTNPNKEEIIRIYNTSGTLKNTIQFPYPITSLIQYKNGIWIAVKNVVFLYDPNSLSKTVEWEAHTQIIQLFCITTDHIWSADKNGIITIWLSENGQIRNVKSLTLHSGSSIRCLKFISPNFVISLAGDNIIIWNADRLIPLQEIRMNSLIIGIASFQSCFVTYDAFSVKKYSKGDFRKVTPNQQNQQKLQQNQQNQSVSFSSFQRNSPPVRSNSEAKFQGAFTSRKPSELSRGQSHSTIDSVQQRELLSKQRITGTKASSHRGPSASRISRLNRPHSIHQGSNSTNTDPQFLIGSRNTNTSTSTKSSEDLNSPTPTKKFMITRPGEKQRIRKQKLDQSDCNTSPPSDTDVPTSTSRSTSTSFVSRRRPAPLRSRTATLNESAPQRAKEWTSSRPATVEGYQPTGNATNEPTRAEANAKRKVKSFI